MTPSRLALMVLLVALVLLAAAGPAMAADPSPTPMVAVDPRTGPMATTTGNSALAAFVVIMLGVVTATLTALAVRILPRAR